MEVVRTSLTCGSSGHITYMWQQWDREHVIYISDNNWFHVCQEFLSDDLVSEMVGYITRETIVGLKWMVILHVRRLVA